MADTMRGRLLDEVALYLHQQGIGVLGSTLFKGAIPLDTPQLAVQNSLLALVEMPGQAGMAVHEGRQQTVEQPVLQVVTRGEPHDYMDARIRAQAAFLALQQVRNSMLSGTRYLWIRAQQSPHLLRWDEMGRPLLTFQVQCAKGLYQEPETMLPPTSFVLGFVHSTLVVIPSTLHQLETADLLWAVYDAQTPAQWIQPNSFSVHPVTRAVTMTFAGAQNGRVVLASGVTPGYPMAFTNQTALLVPGAQHGLGTRDIFPVLYDSQTPASVVGWQLLTVHPTTFDVAVTFAGPQSGRLILFGAV